MENKKNKLFPNWNHLFKIYPVSKIENQSFNYSKQLNNINEIKYHPITGRFLNNNELELNYQKKFLSENTERSFRICLTFIIFYISFTAPNFLNLTSKDPDFRSRSFTYSYFVYPTISPIPFLLFLSFHKKYKFYYQEIYTLIILCWSISFLAGGIHSMISEWFSYIRSDVLYLLNYLKFSFPKDQLFILDGKDISLNIPWWQHKRTSGTSQELFFYYLSNILLPAATMNINLVRIVMIFFLVPLFRIDTIHYGFIVILVSLSYAILTYIYYPVTYSTPFQINKTLVYSFPTIISIIMILRNRNFEKMMRQDFIHVWMAEKEVEIAKKQKELIAQENINLKKELENHKSLYGTDIILDLDSPFHKILTELKNFHDHLIIPNEKTKINDIINSLSRLDSNLFTPDIKSQMIEQNSVDKDTKNWAISVLGNTNYTRNQKVQNITSSNPFTINSNGTNDIHKVDSTFESNIHITKNKIKNRISIIDINLNNNNNTNHKINDKIINILPTKLIIEDNILNNIQLKIQKYGWDINVLLFEKETYNHPLLFIMLTIFNMHQLYELCNLNKQIVQNFLYLIDSGYISNPYHNNYHAADVVCSVHYLITILSNGHIRTILTNYEFFAALIAAAIHDFKHPGRSNHYMIKLSSDYALQYSDKSVLENMHLAESFFIIKRDNNCNIFNNMIEKQYKDIRKAIIEMVLSTDLSLHLQLVGTLKTTLISQEKLNISNDPIVLMKVIIKCADIGHSAKNKKLHGIWSKMIIEEFFLQGDKERELNIEISPFMDRYQENSAKNQIGFFEFIVLPFYETVAEVIFTQEFQSILQNTKINYSLWKDAVKADMTSIDKIQSQIFDS